MEVKGVLEFKKMLSVVKLQITITIILSIIFSIVFGVRTGPWIILPPTLPLIIGAPFAHLSVIVGSIAISVMILWAGNRIAKTTNSKAIESVFVGAFIGFISSVVSAICAIFSLVISGVFSIYSAKVTTTVLMVAIVATPTVLLADIIVGCILGTVGWFVGRRML